jgi:hypothetical protein
MRTIPIPEACPMRCRSSAHVVAACAVVAIALTAAESSGQSWSAERLPTNPLITVTSAASLGGNVNGPTVIRVPEWIERPLGRYYMYFANHMGETIRLAYADELTGPWRIHEPGVLDVRETAFYRPQPDPEGPRADFYTHVASPEILVDDEGRRLILWFHGWWTNGERWPETLPEARAWARGRGYGQITQVAVSSDGLSFTSQAALTRTPYLRVFELDGQLYGVSRLGTLSRSSDPLEAFEVGPSLFRDTPFAGRVRHVALVPRGRRLEVFFTAIGDAPEMIMVASVELDGDWTGWRAGPAAEVLRPEAAYECVHLPVAPSEAGDIAVSVRQLRDPFVLDEDGRAVLFYAACGEQAIAGATLEER